MPVIKSKFYKIKKDNLHNVEKLIKDLNTNKIKEIECIELKYDDYHEIYLIEIKNTYYSIYRIPLFFYDFRVKMYRDNFEKIDNRDKYYDLCKKMYRFYYFIEQKFNELVFIV